MPPLIGDEERRVNRTPAGGSVFGLAIDAEDALLEYLETFYHLGIAGKALDRFGAIDFATSIAPGLRDVLLTGKVYEAVRRKSKNRKNPYDAVVVDAPPTGRISAFLNVHQAVSGLARMGPIRNQADSIMTMLRSDDTVVHLVTLLEEMPVTETQEAVAGLRPTRIKVATVIENMVVPSPLDDAQLAAAAAAEQIIQIPGWPAKQNEALTAEFAVEASRNLQQRSRHERLRDLSVPLAQIEFDPTGIDTGALHAIADQLSEQLDLDAA